MSAFDDACKMANGPLLRLFGDVVEVGGVEGVAVVTPDTDMTLGGGVQLYNGAHLLFEQTSFPLIAVNSHVVHRANTYIVMELDDVDSAGMREARMARQ